MKKITALIIAILSPLLFATREINGPLDQQMMTKEINQNKSSFESLGDMFTMGKKPEISQLLGSLWPGRCFKRDEPYKAYNGVYHLRKRKKANQEKGDSYEAVSAWIPSEAPNYWDKISLSEFLHTAKYLPYLEVSEKENALTFHFKEYSTTLKASGEYLISENKRRDEVLLRCYYFKMN